jgi:hypothetical protein
VSVLHVLAALDDISQHALVTTIQLLTMDFN